VIRLRKESLELSKGTIELHDAPEGVLAFSRTYKDKEMLCFFNMDTVAKQVAVSCAFKTVLSQHANATNRVVALGVNGFCFLQIGKG
jgi:alpha-glucosidase